MEGDTLYPVGDAYTYPGPIGDRVAVSGPTLTTPEPGRQVLHSVYYAGPDLLISEDVSFSDGSRTVGLTYSVKNIAGKAVSFRAMLASV